MHTYYSLCDSYATEPVNETYELSELLVRDGLTSPRERTTTVDWEQVFREQSRGNGKALYSGQATTMFEKIRVRRGRQARGVNTKLQRHEEHREARPSPRVFVLGTLTRTPRANIRLPACLAGLS